MNNRKKKSDSVFGIAMTGVFSGLGIALLYIGSVFDILDITLAAAASIICVFFVMELSPIRAFFLYAVTGTLSLLLLPNKFPAAMYIVFIGYYPILKAFIERKTKKIPGFAIKMVIFNAALFALIFISKWLFEIPDSIFMLEIIFILLANVTFVMYDLALTRLISLYFHKIRPRLKFKIKK